MSLALGLGYMFATNMFATNMFATNMFATNMFETNVFDTNVFDTNVFLAVIALSVPLCWLSCKSLAFPLRFRLALVAWHRYLLHAAL